jgi:hypothetical protein
MGTATLEQAATADVSILGSVSFGWLHEQRGFLVDERYYMDPEYHMEQDRAMSLLARERFKDYRIYNLEAHLVQPEFRRKRPCLVGGFQPNLILAACCGAKFVYHGDKDPDVTLTPLQDIQSIDALRKIDLLNAWPVTRFHRQVLEMQRKFGEAVDVIPPFFWDRSGRATFHGPITTAQKLMGERFFLEMVDNPGFAHEFLDWIADSYIALARHFAALAGLPIRSVHIGDCSACMIGADQFVEFGRAPVAKLIAALGPGRLHSCGNSTHLLEAFREVPGIGTLNVGSGTSVAKAREVFGNGVVIDVMPDPKLLVFGTPDECAAWARQSIAENAGGSMEIQYHFDLGTPEANAKALHHTVRDAGFPEHVIEPAV